MNKKLYRDDIHKKLGGVCAGLAEYYGMDVAIVRIVFLLTSILHGVGLLAYIVFWIALPKKPLQFKHPIVDYTVPPENPLFNDPQYYAPVKNSSGGSVTAGVILLVIGVFFILRNFDFIPHIHFMHVWPLILIAIGIAVLFGGGDKRPWEKHGFPKQDTPQNDHSQNDNTSTF